MCNFLYKLAMMTSYHRNRLMLITRFLMELTQNKGVHSQDDVIIEQDLGSLVFTWHFEFQK